MTLTLLGGCAPDPVDPVEPPVVVVDFDGDGIPAAEPIVLAPPAIRPKVTAMRPKAPAKRSKAPAYPDRRNQHQEDRECDIIQRAAAAAQQEGTHFENGTVRREN
jgi:hypothetical protein